MLRRFGSCARQGATCLSIEILFSDIMTPLDAAGVEIDVAPGPVIKSPVRNAADLAKLRLPETDEIAPYVSDAIRLIRAESNTPLIGFGGAPITLAAYVVQGSGSKDYALLRQFLRTESAVAHRLMTLLTDLSIRYLTMQVAAGAQAIQLFDSWAGLHDTRTYEEFAKPYNARILAAIQDLGVPVIYLAVGASHLYETIADLPADVFGVDWRTSIRSARGVFGERAVQGNLDPSWMLARPEELKPAVDRVLDDACGGPHIFNLGHGMMKETDPDNVARVVDWVHERSPQGPGTGSKAS